MPKHAKHKKLSEPSTSAASAMVRQAIELTSVEALNKVLFGSGVSPTFVIFVRMTGCHWCAQALPLYSEAAKHAHIPFFVVEKDLVNAPIRQAFGIQGYPAIVYVNLPRKNWVAYPMDAERTTERFVSFASAAAAATSA
jgi:thiol-disulfide isomerase/thioredoxin